MSKPPSTCPGNGAGSTRPCAICSPSFCSTPWSRCSIAGCPARHLPRREILPGAAVTVVLWLALASLFSLYLQNLGRFSLTYGSLGGIVMTLMFFYLSATIFIFGAEINGARRRDEAARLRARTGGRAGGARWLIRSTAATMRRVRDFLSRSLPMCAAMPLMAGKRGLIMGIANERSLAWGIAKAVAAHGAELAADLSGRGAGASACGRSPSSLGRVWCCRLRRDRRGQPRRAVRDDQRALAPARFRRPRDRVLRQGGAQGQVSRHQPRQFPDAR